MYIETAQQSTLCRLSLLDLKQPPVQVEMFRASNCKIIPISLPEKIASSETRPGHR